MRDRNLTSESFLTGFEGVQFVLNEVEAGEADACDSALGTLVQMGVHALHEILERVHEVGEVGDPLLDH